MLALCLGAVVNQARAQQPASKSNQTGDSARSGDSELSNLVAQWRLGRRAVFTLEGESQPPKASGPVFTITMAEAAIPPLAALV